MSEENNVHGCLADSLSGMATVAGQMGSHPGCLGRVHWLGSIDHDSFRSRQNSYWSRFYESPFRPKNFRANLFSNFGAKFCPKPTDINDLAI
jgi:hypothetical protein